MMTVVAIPERHGNKARTVADKQYAVPDMQPALKIWK
jgi:hypothetical protein